MTPRIPLFWRRWRRSRSLCTAHCTYFCRGHIAERTCRTIPRFLVVVVLYKTKSQVSAIFGRRVGLPRFPVRKNIYTVRSVLIRDLYIFRKTSRFNSILNRSRIGRKTRIPSGLIVKFPLSDTTRSSLFQYGRFAHLIFTFTIIFTFTVSLTSLHSMYVYVHSENFCSLLCDYERLLSDSKFTQRFFSEKGASRRRSIEM